MNINKQKSNSTYEKIYAAVRFIPGGMVATYGQISSLVDKCTPRMVGYAMARLPFDPTVPWHRVVNSKGEISIRSNGSRCSEQRELLEHEGILFDSRERINLKKYRWKQEY
jgi:methylated-DNA-protein-cysteine methyltransferase-like protein